MCLSEAILREGGCFAWEEEGVGRAAERYLGCAGKEEEGLEGMRM